MATLIKASCHDCGDVELAVDDVQVRVCSEGERGSYIFQCPICLMAVVKAAEPRIVDLLVASGVELTVWRLPSELFEAHEGAPITHDDLIDFHHLLQGDGWFDGVVALHARP